MSFALVAVTVIPLFGTAVLPADSTSGTDLPSSQTPGAGWQIAYIVVALLFLAAPVSVVVFARRKWLGWLVVSLVASALMFGAGLWALGII